ncbi:2-oxoglutarate and iron-dependent oxygenase domain-containing 3 [Pelobates cultripes]|uniref:2-oxoglutarate and iron-dependent oxygenase domain-containing 3 n=1 Tax=Pelobates cultripes TaxID=61616 RepID=A0AAD1S3Q4_PELCU|nr:2-oxoglutarate and iron-dependent oxygenase domain-containing 3 [Pelobates cultripes]
MGGMVLICRHILCFYVSMLEPSGIGIKKSRPRSTSWQKFIVGGILCVAGSLVGGLLVWHHQSSVGMEVLAAQRETLDHRFYQVPCSEDYNNHRRFAGCTPRKCGRAVTDAVITRQEAEKMLRIAEAGFSLGGSDGGASILDLHSGALSMGKHFVNMYRYFGEKVREILTEEDFQLYRELRLRIQGEIARTFNINASSIYLTKPTFFSRMNSSEAKTTHDEYWHPHIDKVTYGSFDYTSLLYLSDYSRDFEGGRFVFIDSGSNSTVEPKAVQFCVNFSFLGCRRTCAIIWGSSTADDRFRDKRWRKNIKLRAEHKLSMGCSQEMRAAITY